jgi:hypothetical protein
MSDQVTAVVRIAKEDQMSQRKRIALVTVLVASLTGIGVFSFAQVQVQRTDEPVILSGSDVGFPVEGHKSERRTDRLTGQTGSVDIAVGQLVVRINGQWVEAQLDGRGLARPATN